MYTEACEATHVRGEQSAEVLDLRMGCLGERLSERARARRRVRDAPTPTVVDNAVSAASALPALDRCADVALLRAVVKPPEDPARARADRGEASEEVAKVNALSSAGRCDQAKTKAGARGRRPAGAARIPAARGRDFVRSGTPVRHLSRYAGSDRRTSRTRSWPPRPLGTTRSRSRLRPGSGSAYADRTHDIRRGGAGFGTREAILARFPGHPLIEAHVAASRRDRPAGGGSIRGRLARGAARAGHPRVVARPVEHRGRHVGVNVGRGPPRPRARRGGRGRASAAAIDDLLEAFSARTTVGSRVASLDEGGDPDVARTIPGRQAALAKALAIWRQHDGGSPSHRLWLARSGQAAAGRARCARGGRIVRRVAESPRRSRILASRPRRGSRSRVRSSLLPRELGGEPSSSPRARTPRWPRSRRPRGW